MNKIIKYSLAAVLSFGISSSCLAIVISDTNAGTDDGASVGVVDTFKAVAEKAGNPTDETTWVNSILQLDPLVTYVVKAEDVTYYSTLNSATIFAFAFNPVPGDDYFLIKNAKLMALFKNVADVDWGVFDISDIPDVVDSDDKTIKFNLDSDSFLISHVTRFDDPSTDDGGGGGQGQVPEPGILALFGMGLLGMGLPHLRRKRKTS